MTGPFRPDELDGAAGMTPDELAAEARLARELEAAADGAPVKASPGFADRVMAAVAAEPLPAPARAAGHAVRTAALLALLASIRDAFRVTFSGGFPAMVRAQALAVVLVVVALGGGVTYGAAAALGLLGDDTRPPVETPAPEAEETTSPDAPVTVEPSADSSDDVVPSIEPAESEEPGESAEPSGTPESEESGEAATDNNGGSDDETAAPTKKATPQPTPKPTPKPTPGPTPRPTATPDDEETQTPDPTGTPRPSDTPDPSETPHTDSD